MFIDRSWWELIFLPVFSVFSFLKLIFLNWKGVLSQVKHRLVQEYFPTKIYINYLPRVNLNSLR